MTQCLSLPASFMCQHILHLEFLCLPSSLPLPPIHLFPYVFKPQHTQLQVLVAVAHAAQHPPALRIRLTYPDHVGAMWPRAAYELFSRPPPPTSPTHPTSPIQLDLAVFQTGLNTKHTRKITAGWYKSLVVMWGSKRPTANKLFTSAWTSSERCTEHTAAG